MPGIEMKDLAGQAIGAAAKEAVTGGNMMSQIKGIFGVIKDGLDLVNYLKAQGFNLDAPSGGETAITAAPAAAPAKSPAAAQSRALAKAVGYLRANGEKTVGELIDGFRPMQLKSLADIIDLIGKGGF